MASPRGDETVASRLRSTSQVSGICQVFLLVRFVFSVVYWHRQVRWSLDHFVSVTPLNCYSSSSRDQRTKYKVNLSLTIIQQAWPSSIIIFSGLQCYIEPLSYAILVIFLFLLFSIRYTPITMNINSARLHLLLSIICYYTHLTENMYILLTLLVNINLSSLIVRTSWALLLVQLRGYSIWQIRIRGHQLRNIAIRWSGINRRENKFFFHLSAFVQYSMTVARWPSRCSFKYLVISILILRLIILNL